MSIKDEIIKKKSNSIFKKILIPIAFLAIGYFVYTNYFSNQDTNKEENTLKTAVVSKNDIKIFIQGEGKIIKQESVNLNFPINGTIKEIYVKEGDKVNKGQILAKLDDKDLKFKLEQAKIALKNAQANLSAKINSLSEDEINIYKQQYEQAKLNYNLLKDQFDTDLKIAETNIKDLEKEYENTQKLNEINVQNSIVSVNTAKIELATAKENLNSTLKEEKTKLQNLKEDALEKIKLALSFFDQALYNTDKLFGITDENKNYNDSFENYLSAKNSALKEEIKQNFLKTNSYYLKFKGEYLNKDIQTNLNEIISIGESISYILDLSLNALKASVASSTLSQNMIDNYIKDFETYLNNIKNQVNNLKQAKQLIQEQQISYESKKISLENQVKNAQAKLELAQSNLERVKKTNEINLINIKSKLETAKQQYESLLVKKKNSLQISQKQIDLAFLTYKSKLSGPTKAELAPFYVAVENVKKQVEQAEKDLQNAILISSYTGYVLDIFYKVGENISSNNTFIKLGTNSQNLIEAYLEEGDVIKIYSGQKVYINVDSMEGLVFTGKVFFVSNKGEEDNNGIITYKVLISFDNNDKRIKDGMSVSLEFITKEAKNVLTIPVEAVKTINGKPAVLRADGKWVNIVPGLTDNNIVEVISGLSLGEKIVY